MKKQIFLVIALCFLINAAKSQQNPNIIFIKGHITNPLNKPIPGRNVTIMSDSMLNSNFLHYKTLTTDNNGFYCDTIFLPAWHQDQIRLVVWTSDCKNHYQSQLIVYFSDVSDYTADFTICDDITHSCKSNFFSYKNDSISSSIYAYRFLSTSSGDNLNNWLWNFGDSTSSTEEQPLHKYNQSGKYKVCLKVSSTENNIILCEDTYCSEVNVEGIVPPPKCSAYFTYSFRNPINDSIEVLPVKGKTIAFKDMSKAANNINYYLIWDFGDGNTASEQNPIHYFNPGSYNVCVTMSTTGDSSKYCTDTYCQTILIADHSDSCHASFTYSSDTSSYHFTDLSTGKIIIWNWQYGDGNTSAEKNPSHQYLYAGTYNVCLTVTNDSLTCIDVMCKSVYVKGKPGNCDISFNYYTDSTGVTIPEMKVYRFTASSLSQPQQLIWEFGDGSTSNEVSPSHGFYPGGYYVCLTAVFNQDSTICKASSCQKLYLDTLTPPPPPNNCSSSFTYNIAASDTAFAVSFKSYTKNQQNVIYLWDFGDGNNATTQENNIVHEYNKTGNYNVCLTTTSKTNADTLSCSFTSCQVIAQNVDSTFYGAMSGQIFADSNYADKGLVKIVKYNYTPNTGISFFDAAQIEADGKYNFNKIPFGGYYINAELYSTSQYYMHYLPTYYGDTWNWSEAKTVSVGDFVPTNNVVIHLVPVKEHKNGTGVIAGHINDNYYKSAKDAPVSNTEVVLIDSQKNAIGLTYSDIQGQFSFSQLEFGTYNVYAEILGIEAVPAEVTLDASNPAITNADFTINTTTNKIFPDATVSVKPINKAENDYSDFYPNPVNNTAYLTAIISKPANLNIQIINQLGQTEQITYIMLNQGSSIVEVNTEGLAKGMYYIRISDNYNSLYKRVIKLD